MRAVNYGIVGKCRKETRLRSGPEKPEAFLLEIRSPNKRNIHTNTNTNTNSNTIEILVVILIVILILTLNPKP